MRERFLHINPHAKRAKILVCIFKGFFPRSRFSSVWVCGGEGVWEEEEEGGPPCSKAKRKFCCLLPSSDVNVWGVRFSPVLGWWLTFVNTQCHSSPLPLPVGERRWALSTGVSIWATVSGLCSVNNLPKYSMRILRPLPPAFV